MSKRMRELAEQAGYYIDPDFDIEFEVFAELIVKECADTVSDCSVEYCTRSQIVKEIKEHFGVEE